MWTLASAFLIVMLGQRSTADGWRPPSARPEVDELRVAVVACLMALMARALTTSVQMIWTYVSAATVSDGLHDDQRGSWLHFRILLVWALFLTLAGSAATATMLRWRERLSASDDDDSNRGEDAALAPPPPQAPPAPPMNHRMSVSDDGAFGGMGGYRAPMRTLPVLSLFRGETEARAQRCGQWLRPAAMRVLLLCERVLSYVTAWAWTDVFFASASRPSLWGVLKDSGVALTLSLAVIAWLVLVGGALELRVGADVERSVVESYFVANSASFFVGFAWWKVLRDLAALSGRAAVPHLSPYDEPLAQVERDVEAYSTYEFAGALAGNFFYGPVLTFVVIWAKHVYLSTFLETTARSVDKARGATPPRAHAPDVRVVFAGNGPLEVEEDPIVEARQRTRETREYSRKLGHKLGQRARKLSTEMM
jgi:hypothetical protein